MYVHIYMCILLYLYDNCHNVFIKSKNKKRKKCKSVDENTSKSGQIIILLREEREKDSQGT